MCAYRYEILFGLDAGVVCGVGFSLGKSVKYGVGICVEFVGVWCGWFLRIYFGRSAWLGNQLGIIVKYVK